GGEGVVVVAGGRLARVAEATTVVRDDPVTRVQQNGYLLLPRGPTEWVAVDEHHRRTRAVVLVVDLDVAGVLPTDGDVWHRILLLVRLLIRFQSFEYLPTDGWSPHAFT